MHTHVGHGLIFDTAAWLHRGLGTESEETLHVSAGNRERDAVIEPLPQRHTRGARAAVHACPDELRRPGRVHVACGGPLARVCSCLCVSVVEHTCILHALAYTITCV